MKGEHRRTAAENDAFTRWKRWLGYMQRPGISKSIKRQSHKIDRQVGKRKIDEQRD